MTTYFKGDEAEYTFNVLELHGGVFYEVRMLEGHEKGKIKVVKDKPKGFSAYRLPDKRIVLVDASAAKDARMIDFTLSNGHIVLAFQVA